MADVFRISIRGEPQTKGSTKSFVIKKKAGGLGVVTTGDNPRTRPWERLMAQAISEKWEGPRWEGPVDLEVHFSFVRPDSAKKRNWPHKQGPGDASKLQRTVEDACMLAGAIKDDSQVVSWVGTKEYRDTPGVEIILTKLE